MIPDFHVVTGIAPIAGGSARSGDWVCLKNYHHCTIVVTIAQGNAATTAVTVDKAKTAAGGSNSDGISMTNFYVATGDLTASDAFTKQTAAASFTSSAAGTGTTLMRIEYDAAELGDDYDFLQVELGASNAANIVSAHYILSNPRYGRSPDGALTAIA